MKIVILGAGGAIGKTIARTMVARGDQVRVVGRNLLRLQRAFPDISIEPVEADLRTTDDCAKAIEGMDAAVYAVGLKYSKKDFANYPKLMEVFLSAADSSQLKQLILVTGVYSYGIPQSDKVTETHPRNPVSVKGQFRKEQEDLVLGAHNPNGLKTIVLRLPDFYGPEVDASMANNIFNSAAVGNERVYLLGPIDKPHEFVFTPDVGPVVADLMAKPEVFGSAYNFAGVDSISIRDFTEQVFAIAGDVKPVYWVIKGLPLRFFGLFNPLLREMIEMEYLLKTPVILDDSKLKRVLSNLKKTSYEEGIAQTIVGFRKRMVRT